MSSFTLFSFIEVSSHLAYSILQFSPSFPWNYLHIAGHVLKITRTQLSWDLNSRFPKGQLNSRHSSIELMRQSKVLLPAHREAAWDGQHVPIVAEENKVTQRQRKQSQAKVFTLPWRRFQFLPGCPFCNLKDNLFCLLGRPITEFSQSY